MNDLAPGKPRQAPPREQEALVAETVALERAIGAAFACPARPKNKRKGTAKLTIDGRLSKKRQERLQALPGWVWDARP